jgi:hypothetical protein
MMKHLFPLRKAARIQQLPLRYKQNEIWNDAKTQALDQEMHTLDMKA